MSRRSNKSPPQHIVLNTDQGLLSGGLFFVKNLSQWYERVARPLPWRVLWNQQRNPWHVWVSEIMLQQTAIKSVIPIYEVFFKQFPDHLTLAKASQEEIRLAVRGLGYYRRFDNLHKACQQLANVNAPLPDTYDGWFNLPGIGPYTAAAIASITLGVPRGVVDGNVERVLCRLLDIRSEPNLPHLKRRFQSIMDSWCEIGIPGTINQAVMELGQTICSPTSPKCDACPIKTRCAAFAASSQMVAPAVKSKPNFTSESLNLHIIQRGDNIALIRRPTNAKFLQNTWGFLTESKSKSRKNLIGTVKHAITTHKITATVSLEISRKETLTQTDNTNSLSSINLSDVRWLPSQVVERNLVSNLDRKAWQLFLKSQTSQNKRHHTKQLKHV